MAQFWEVFHYAGPTPDKLYEWMAVNTASPKYSATDSLYGWLTTESPFHGIWQNRYLMQNDNHGVLVAYYEE